MNARLKQRRFAHEYLKTGGNGVQAVYAAGYVQGYNAACVTASRLLRNAKVQEAIQKDMEKRAMSALEVVENLTKVAETDTKIGGSEKLKALELLGKFHKLFTDKVETTDTSARDGAESAIESAISRIMKQDNLSEPDAAKTLFLQVADAPGLSDPSNWPERLRPYLSEVSQSSEAEQ